MGFLGDFGYCLLRKKRFVSACFLAFSFGGKAGVRLTCIRRYMCGCLFAFSYSVQVWTKLILFEGTFLVKEKKFAFVMG